MADPTSLLQYMASQTRYYQDQANAINAEREAAKARAVDAAMASLPQGGSLPPLPASDPRSQQSVLERASYSDTKLREQLGQPPLGASPAHPLENYLGAVSSQEEYRPAMMQYLASGGKRPAWFTGNYAQDKPQIDAAIAATMTPREQMIREEAKQQILDREEARQARNQLAQDALEQRKREQAQKREGLATKAKIPNRDDRLTALQVLGGVLGDKFGNMSEQAQDAAAARAASLAKAKIGTPEAEGVDYESLLQDAYNDMLARGELRLPEAGGWFGIGAKPASFTPQRPDTAAPATPQQAPSAPAVPAPSAMAPAVPKPGEVVRGWRFRGGDPSNKASWERISK